MTPRQPISLRKLWLWCLTIAYGLITVYLSFTSIVSICIGLGNMDKAGFWVPILMGGAFLIVLFHVSIRVIKHMIKQMKEEDVLSI